MPDDWKPTHRHIKGMECRVIGVGKMQVGKHIDWALLRDYDEVVIYQEEDGTLWVRTKADFDDDRFRPLSEETK